MHPCTWPVKVRNYYAQDPTEFESETFFGLVHAIATTIQSETAQLLKYRDIAEKREKVRCVVVGARQRWW